MNAPSSNRMDVIAIRRLDTAALRQLRAAVQAAPRVAPVSIKPVAVTVRPPAPAQSTRGRPMAMATFALGLLLGAFSSHLGETRSTALQAPASPPVQPAETAAPAIAATTATAPSPTTDVPKTATPLTEPSSSPRPPRRHHSS
ncbi:MAG: hypothetical protein ACLQVI_34740 [Polyangiaceae bacterium]